MRTTRIPVLVLPLVLAAFMTKAEEPITPDQVREKYPLALSGPCQDNESKLKGGCYMFARPDGRFYMVFVHDGKPLFMRLTHEGGYETVWHAPEGVLL